MTRSTYYRERTCTGCHRTFNGKSRKCDSCAATTRNCTECGDQFTGLHKKCLTCRCANRMCASCSSTFNGDTKDCDRCRRKEHTCSGCGAAFKSSGSTKCWRCSAQTRTCTDCDKTFTGLGTRCCVCTKTERQCTECDRTFTGNGRKCWACQITPRKCDECGREFSTGSLTCKTCQWRALPQSERRARSHAYVNARRARLAAAQVTGPVPAAVYAAVLAEDICVYCDRRAEHVDHVRPLAQGGWEHESNLVPACADCNLSKSGRLLTEWDMDRVEHGVASSPKVAAEYLRLLSDGQVGAQQTRYSGDLAFIEP